MGQKAEMQSAGINILFSMHLPVKVLKKKGLYVSSCPILDVVSQGNTEQEAKNNLVEAVTAFVVSCFERGTLEAVLKQCGFSPIYSEPTYPKHDYGSDYIDVPIPIFASHESRCHA